MNKFLLSCFLALGIGANAQFNYNGDFEDVGAQYGQFGGGSVEAAAACSGSYGGQTLFTSAIASSGWMIDTSGIPQTSNGQRVSLTASYKKPAGFVGTISLAYFIKDKVTGSWSVFPVGTTVSLTAAAVTACQPLSASIPAGVLQPDSTIGLGVWMVKGSAAGAVYVDNINIEQDTSVTTVPDCTVLTAPAAGSTVPSGAALFSWASAQRAINYKLTVGTTPGGTDVYNNVVAGTSVNVNLPANSVLYAKLVPSNTIGDAQGCAEISFSTNNQVSYCGPIVSTIPASTYPISAVTFAGKGPNTSSAAVGSPAYEDFTSYVFNAVAGATYPLTVTGTGLGANRFGMTVFIDWNSNGNFTDAGEQYFVDPANFKGGTGATITLNGNIAIPANATAGNKRMRIKYNFSSSTTALNPALADGCSNMTNGQTEDYTIALTTPGMATVGVNKADLSVYPNPFQDVLKISDVKGVQSVSVSDVSGRQLKTLKASAELNLSELKSGLYIVTLHMEDGTVKSFKAIKK
ncbi:GEVED domain-containing protein [Kaistella palustris]|uniref:GEVED domain-containing protein n=1 Tax=Kaistella palustris TaxID=493376 RepID=UPI0003F6EFCC|nr:GEVED domain-containing protein [Kaistella palustris]